MLALVFPGVAVPMVGAPGTVRGVTLTLPLALLVPIAFVAFTLQLYAVPFVRLETVTGLALPVPPVPPAGVHVAAYPVIGEPPSDAGAVKAMLALALPGVAGPIVGAPGGPTGVTFASLEADPVPTTLVAVTLQPYCTPFVRFITTIGLDEPFTVRVVCCVAAHVAVYDVIAEPPFDAGAVNATVAWPLPAVTVPIVGAPGTFAGVTFALPEAAELPRALVAITLQLYCVPFVSPLTVMGLVDPVPVTPAPPVGAHVAV